MPQEVSGPSSPGTARPVETSQKVDKGKGQAVDTQLAIDSPSPESPPSVAAATGSASPTPRSTPRSSPPAAPISSATGDVSLSTWVDASGVNFPDSLHALAYITACLHFGMWEAVDLLPVRPAPHARHPDPPMRRAVLTSSVRREPHPRIPILGCEPPASVAAPPRFLPPHLMHIMMEPEYTVGGGVDRRTVGSARTPGPRAFQDMFWIFLGMAKELHEQGLLPALSLDLDASPEGRRELVAAGLLDVAPPYTGPTYPGDMPDVSSAFDAVPDAEPVPERQPRGLAVSDFIEAGLCGSGPVPGTAAYRHYAAESRGAESHGLNANGRAKDPMWSQPQIPRQRRRSGESGQDVSGGRDGESRAKRKKTA